MGTHNPMAADPTLRLLAGMGMERSRQEFL